MKKSDLADALRHLGTGYTSKNKKNPADPIVKLLRFLADRNEETVGEIVSALQEPTPKKPAKVTAISAAAGQYLERLNTQINNNSNFESIFLSIKTLPKLSVIHIAKGYAYKPGIDSKQKALVAIRDEFYSRSRERNKATNEENSLLM